MHLQMGLVLAFGLACSSVFWPTNANAQDAPIVTADPALNAELPQAFTKAYAREALIDRWRRDRDPMQAVLLFKAAIMAEGGASRDAIVTELAATRNKWMADQNAGQRADWQIDEDYKTMIRHAGAIASSRVDDTTGAAIEAGSDLLIMTTESLLKDGEVQAASREMGLTYRSVRESEETIAEMVMTNFEKYPTLREVWDEQFATSIGFRPTDDIAAVSAAFPEFATGKDVQQILGLLTSGDAEVAINSNSRREILTSIQGMLDSAQIENNANFDELKAMGVASQDMLGALVTDVQTRRDEERRHAEAQVVAEGRRAGAFLATTALGLIDPDVGQQAGALVDFAFEVNRSVEAYSAALKLGEEFSGSASLALTGNFVGAALSLASAFGSSGPSSDEAILAELANIRRDIQRLREEMHTRFDIVDAKLDAIYKRLDEGLGDLEDQLRYETGRSLELIVSELTNIRIGQSTSNSLLWNRSNWFETYLDDPLEVCVLRKQNSTVVLTDREFVDCELTVGNRLRQTDLGKAQVPSFSDPMEMANVLRERPDASVRVSLLVFDHNNEIFSKLVGPESWVLAAASYLNFLADWPMQKDLISDLDYEIALVEGQRLLYAIEKLQSAIGSNQGKLGPKTESFLSQLHLGGDTLRKLVKESEAYYYQHALNGRPSLHLLDPDVHMEVRDSDAFAPAVTEPPAFCFTHYHYGALPPPPGLFRKLPTVIQQAIDLGFGSLSYCLDVRYDQPWEEIWNDNATENYGTRDTGPGPYTAQLTVNYTWEHLSCPGGHNITSVFFGSVSDMGRMAGRYGETAPYPDPEIWHNDWRNRFLDVVVSGVPGTTLRYFYSDAQRVCVEQSLNPVIQQQLEGYKAQLSIVMYDWLRNSTEVSDTDSQIALDSAYFGHWIWFAFNDRLMRSDLLSALVSGGLAPPTIAEAISRASDEGRPAWEAVAIFDQELAAYEAVLRSKTMSALVSPGGDPFGVEAILAQIPQN
jgi:hypothetical protein